jgi:hypothetical protein
MLKSEKLLKKKLKPQMQKSSEKRSVDHPAENDNAVVVGDFSKNSGEEKFRGSDQNLNDKNSDKRDDTLISESKPLEIQPASKSDENPPPTPSMIVSFNFLMLGVAALTAWNGILSAMDFFADCFPDYNIPVYFPIPVFIAINLWSQLIHLFADRINCHVRIIGCQCLIGIIVIILPIEANNIRNEAGFWFCLFIVFLASSCSTILQVSAMGFSQSFPGYYISLYFTGTGISGTVICLLRIFCLASFGNTSEGRLIGTILYFVISGVFMGISMGTHYLFIKTDFYNYYMEKSKGHQRGKITYIYLGLLYLFLTPSSPINVNTIYHFIAKQALF